MVCSLFLVKEPPKMTWNLAAGPSSQHVLFQGPPPRNKDLSEKPMRRELHIQTRARVFSIFQKQQTYKLVARHSVPRYELVDLLFSNGQSVK